GVAGMFIGRWGQQLLPVTAGRVAPIDWRVLIFGLLVTAVTGVAFGMASAVRATGMNLNAALKDTSRSVAASRSVLSRVLLVLQPEFGVCFHRGTRGAVSAARLHRSARDFSELLRHDGDVDPAGPRLHRSR